MKIERNQLRSDIFPWHCSELKKMGAVAKVRGLVKTKTEKTPADGISPLDFCSASIDMDFVSKLPSPFHLMPSTFLRQVIPSSGKNTGSFLT